PLTGLNASSCFINHHLSTDVARLRFNYKLDGGVAPELAAAPMYTKAPAALWNWTGFYIGGNLGGGVASSELKDAASFFDASSTPTTGFATGGAQIGYNYQFGAGLIGIEADVNGNAALKNSALLGADDSPGLLVSAHSDVSGTIR